MVEINKLGTRRTSRVRPLKRKVLSTRTTTSTKQKQHWNGRREAIATARPIHNRLPLCRQAQPAVSRRDDSQTLQGRISKRDGLRSGHRAMPRRLTVTSTSKSDMTTQWNNESTCLLMFRSGTAKPAELPEHNPGTAEKENRHSEQKGCNKDELRNIPSVFQAGR